MMPPLGFVPVPLSDTTAGPPDTLLAMESVAVRAPMRSGSKISFAVQDAPGFSETPLQPSATMVKSPAFVPPRVSDETMSGPFHPVLVIVTVLTIETVPSFTEPNPIDVGLTLIPGTYPVP